MKAILETIENCFLVSQKDITDDGHIIWHKSAYTYYGAEDSKDACEAMVSALYDCMEKIGWINNKYSMHTVSISIVPGTKIEAFAENTN